MGFHEAMDLFVATENLDAPLPAAALLQNYRGEDFEAAEFGHRHPLGIYTLSIARVAAAFEAALDADARFDVDTLATGVDQKQAASQLLEAIERLFQAGTQHFDDTKTVVELFAAHKKPERFQQILSSYEKTIEKERRVFSQPANRIKHNYGILRLLTAEIGAEYLRGVYVEGVSAGGAIGADLTVHRGGKTAFSLNRLFRSMIAALFVNSKAVVSNLHASCGACGAVGFGPLASALRRVGALSNLIFWDESTIVPVVRIQGKGVTLCTAGRGDFRVPAGTVRFSFDFQLDLIAKEYSMPYAGRFDSRTRFAKPARRQSKSSSD